MAAVVAVALGFFAVHAAGEVSAPAAAVGHRLPPPRLPWGAEPAPVDSGPAGATSRQLAAPGPRRLVAEFHPKGRTRPYVAPEPPAPGADGDVYFHYAGGYQIVAADGTYADLMIGKPTLAVGDHHSLAEIAVQAGPNEARNIVEVGWTVDRGVNAGSNDPHLFVYHWVDGRQSCYNACGFVQHSRTVFPGDRLAAGTVQRMGVQFFDGAWWIAFGSEWVGYFPGTLWGGRYSRSEAIQWFGEVASATRKPCSGMGTGAGPGDGSPSARLGPIHLLNATARPAATLNVQSPPPDSPAYAGTRTSDARTVRYGGPGAGVAWGDQDGDGRDDNPEHARCQKLLP